MELNEAIAKIKELLETIGSGIDTNTKSGHRKVRVATLELEKVMKVYRRLSPK